MRELTIAVERDEIASDDLLFVVWAFEQADTKEYLAKLPGRVVHDHDGRLAKGCEIRNTPAMLIVGSENDEYRVLDFSAQGDSQWAINQLTMRQLQMS